jgi:hypothetical protein
MTLLNCGMFQVNLCLLNIYTHYLEAIQDKKLFSLEVGSGERGAGKDNSILFIPQSGKS